MSTHYLLMRTIAAAAVSGIGAVAGIASGVGIAHAFPPGCTSYACWCPGQPLPGQVAGDWDMNACHDWHYSWHDNPQAPHGQVEQGPMDCGYGPGFLPQCKG
ncbi:hypothetical protein AWC05_04085 [Mycobacterium florentinum]|uniref:Uncharacterized protein n=1 Tax=Mycobacterium florentinum TaxID=292462 RepID=A0A1X1TWB5_MYCFL|nr:hypothetical protein [Mycobacterium florentinum]MCV7413640.1 hypothetical protein [Mycobacterium florentinum]ORV48874.1 hypothetical protein AWC05_04085 [Mycobacterium florentinum]BBX77229.1 hypothetical protein MFLOJ_10160 [Mycobacterium florentinum]